MVSEANNDLRYVNLVARVMDSCYRQDEEEIFSFPVTRNIHEFLSSRRTMPEQRFPEFMEYMRGKHPADHEALGTMFRKGYRWNDPFTSDFAGNALRKIAFGPEYLLRFYRDHEFLRTGDYMYASDSRKKIGHVAMVCTGLYAIVNPFALLVLLWQVGSGFAGAGKILSAQMHGDDSVLKLMKKYYQIHNRTRFYILDRVQEYALDRR